MLIRTLLAHYLRHPMQALFLLVGIIIANVLLVGTQLINAQARSSYAEGEQVLGATPSGRIVPSGSGRYLDERLYIQLRTAGFSQTAPVLRQIRRTQDGAVVELLGIDALSMPRPKSEGARQPRSQEVSSMGSAGFSGFAFPPYRVLAAPARLNQLGLSTGDALVLAGGERLPPVVAVNGEHLGYRMLVDLGVLQQATDAAGRLSAILVFEQEEERRRALLEYLPKGVEFVAESSDMDPEQLTQSFHLNLAAMGLLACVVGLFLTYNAVAFSYSDRRELLRRLRLSGVSRRALALALGGELLVFLLLGGAVGLGLGAQLAALLLPGVAQTLAQLYDVYIGFPDALITRGYLLPLVVSFLAAVLCALFPLRAALSAPLLARRAIPWHLSAVALRDKRLAIIGLALLAVALVLSRFTVSTWVALGGMAALLLGTALCLPRVLRLLLGGVSRWVPASAARLNWLVADSRWLLGPAALALMAMVLALVANGGLNTMIASFRDATDQWLDQRLAAQLYVNDAEGRLGGEVTALKGWLRQSYPDVGVTLRLSAEATALNPQGNPVKVQVTDLSDTEPFRSSVQLMASQGSVQARFHSGQGVFISERAWRVDGWQLGDTVSLCNAAKPLPVLGVYHDYGNPQSQWMVSPSLFRACWPDKAAMGIALHGKGDTDWGALRQAMVAQFGLPVNAVTNQEQIKRIALDVFDRTFAVTRALNLLTLLVAGVGVFCAISAIHHHRVGQQALLASLGLSSRERGALLLAQWGLMGLLCMVLVWPLGLTLGWYLSSVVTPAAFGWSFPVQVEVVPYLTLAGVACGALVLAIVIPSLQLLRVSPAAMLREQGV